MQKQKPEISPTLLWEYDLENFDFDKSYKLVIERVLERGDLKEWRSMFHYYGSEKILETVEWSAQLDDKTKAFSRFFINSDFLDAA